GREIRQSIVLVFRPAILDRHTLPVDVAAFAHALPERGNQACPVGRRRAAEESDDRQLRRLLRARREWPSSRRSASKKRDELAAFHSRSLPCFRPRIAHLRTTEDCCLYPTLGEKR